MSALTVASTVRMVHIARQCVARLLLLETLVLMGVLASWRAAAIAAIGVFIVLGAVRVLRRASQQVDLILREELGPVESPTTEQDLVA